MHRVVVIAIALIACKSGSDRPSSGTASGSGTAVAPAPVPAPPPVAVVDAGPAPDGVTQERLAAADRLAAITEKMGADVAASGGDCNKIVAAVEASASDFKLAKAEVERIRAQEPKSPEVSDWFKSRYAQRMMAAMSPLVAAARTCAKDQNFMATMKNLQIMSRRDRLRTKPLDGSGASSPAPEPAPSP